ncbi:hypothetical protein PYCC9005_003437 [Savitreella phatthalungensis]
MRLASILLGLTTIAMSSAQLFAPNSTASAVIIINGNPTTLSSGDCNTACIDVQGALSTCQADVMGDSLAGPGVYTCACKTNDFVNQAERCAACASSFGSLDLFRELKSIIKSCSTLTPPVSASVSYSIPVVTHTSYTTIGASYMSATATASATYESGSPMTTDSATVVAPTITPIPTHASASTYVPTTKSTTTTATATMPINSSGAVPRDLPAIMTSLVWALSIGLVLASGLAGFTSSI